MKKRTTFQTPRGTRVEAVEWAGRFPTMKLTPVFAVPFLQSEGGILEQGLNVRGEPIVGELLSTVELEVVSVYVPDRAVFAAIHEDDPAGHHEETFRDAVASGEPYFQLEAMSPVSSRVVEGIQVNGDLKTCQSVRIGHNIAVNHLRRSVYHDAAQLDVLNNGDITPAIFHKSALDVMGAVLDPEHRVNGTVRLQGSVPVHGLGVPAHADPETTVMRDKSLATQEAADADGIMRHDIVSQYGDYSKLTSKMREFIRDDGTPIYLPDVTAELGLAETGLRLDELWKSRRAAAWAQRFDQLKKQHPQYAEDLILSTAMGLSMDLGLECSTVYRKRGKFADFVRRGSDTLDRAQTDLGATVRWAVPIPTSEFGGQIFTFVTVYPAETLENRPHPIYSRERTGINFVLDEQRQEEYQPLWKRDLTNGRTTPLDPVDEKTVVGHTGYNHHLRQYRTMGWNPATDLTTVDAKYSMFQVGIPLSRETDAVLYPDDVVQTPWADISPEAENIQYRGMSSAYVATPILFGSAPIERNPLLDDLDIFGNDTSLTSPSEQETTGTMGIGDQTQTATTGG